MIQMLFLEIEECKPEPEPRESPRPCQLDASPVSVDSFGHNLGIRKISRSGADMIVRQELCQVRHEL